MRLIIINTFLLFFCSFNLFSQKNQLELNTLFSSSYSIVEVVDIPDQNYYFYDVLPIVGFELEQNIKYFFFKDLIYGNFSIGYSRNGFEGRRFETVIPQEDKKYRQEFWSKVKNNNIKLSLGAGIDFKGQYFITVNANYFIPFSTQMIIKEVWLSDVYAADIFNEPVKSKSDWFGENNFGLELLIGTKIIKKLHLFFGANYGLQSITNVDARRFWLDNRNVKLGIIFNIK